MYKVKMTLPMLAVLLGFVALIGTAATTGQNNTMDDPSWLLDTGGDPTDPADYQPYNGNIEDDCPLQFSQVCGIKAPEGSPDEPDISAVPGLEEALEDGKPHPSIYSRP